MTTELNEEVNRLKNTLNALIESAKKNQKTQDNFFELELFFLESNSYENLIKRILIDLKRKLMLTQVELIVLDRYGDIQLLIQDIYNDLQYPNLTYTNSSQQIKNLYPNQCLNVTLTQDKPLIAELFKSSAQTSQSVAMLPLVRGNNIVGSLHLGSRDSERFKPELESHFFQHLNSIICICIENTLNQERYKHLSLVDLLTRAKNRRYFLQMLSKEIARSSRSRQPLSCLFIDIDFFKKINDQYGHLVGDKALRAVAETISPMLRQSDVLARFGGEEFTVLLPNTQIQQAEEIAQRIRHKVSQIAINTEENMTFNVTISVGVSSWQPRKNETIDPQDIEKQLINLADNCVYQAKNSGRDCVRVANMR